MTDSILLTLLFALCFGALCGLINGVLVGYIQMPAFIVTLATMLIYRSFSQYFCQRIDKALVGGGSSVYKMAREKMSYQPLYDFGNGKALTVPIVGLILLVIMALFVYVTTSTKYGKKVYAVGSNTKGASMAGVNVPLIKVSVFVLTGILVGLAAFLWIAMNASADPATTGSSYEMYAIASCVVGGIYLSGGRGKVHGAFIGSMIIGLLTNIFNMQSWLSTFWESVITGSLVLIVVLLQKVSAMRAEHNRKIVETI
jgi:ribose transport system permease protein